MAEAASEYAAAFGATEGMMVTGYIGIFELTGLEGQWCGWVTGSGGDPTVEHLSPLAPWRVEGMVRKVLRDLDADNVTRE